MANATTKGWTHCWLSHELSATQIAGLTDRTSLATAITFTSKTSSPQTVTFSTPSVSVEMHNLIRFLDNVRNISSVEMVNKTSMGDDSRSEQPGQRIWEHIFNFHWADASGETIEVLSEGATDVFPRLLYLENVHFGKLCLVVNVVTHDDAFNASQPGFSLRMTKYSRENPIWVAA